MNDGQCWEQSQQPWSVQWDPLEVLPGFQFPSYAQPSFEQLADLRSALNGLTVDIAEPVACRPFGWGRIAGEVYFDFFGDGYGVMLVARDVERGALPLEKVNLRLIANGEDAPESHGHNLVGGVAKWFFSLKPGARYAFAFDEA